MSPEFSAHLVPQIGSRILIEFNDYGIMRRQAQESRAYLSLHSHHTIIIKFLFPSDQQSMNIPEINTQGMSVDGNDDEIPRVNVPSSPIASKQYTHKMIPIIRSPDDVSMMGNREWHFTTPADCNVRVTPILTNVQFEKERTNEIKRKKKPL